MSLLHTIFQVISSCILIGLMRVTCCLAAPITLFEDVDFKGIHTTIQIGESTCVNLVGKLNDFYSSVDTMEVCFILCEHLNCRGKCEIVTGKQRDLSRIGVNDIVSSISLCPQHDNKINSRVEASRINGGDILSRTTAPPTFDALNSIAYVTRRSRRRLVPTPNHKLQVLLSKIGAPSYLPNTDRSTSQDDIVRLIVENNSSLHSRLPPVNTTPSRTRSRSRSNGGDERRLPNNTTNFNPYQINSNYSNDSYNSNHDRKRIPHISNRRKRRRLPIPTNLQLPLQLPQKPIIIQNTQQISST